MHFLSILMVATRAFIGPAAPIHAAPQFPDSQLDLDHYFKGYDACFVLLDTKTGRISRYKPKRCDTRFSPCSTFKIPNALIGLETGVLDGPDHAFKWDGTRHRRKACNRDHTLRTAVRDSVVWYFQRVADGVGEKRMRQWLSDAGYGNQDISGGLTQFWLGDSLEISANEQVAFLRKLQDGSLPMSKRSQELVKDILIVEQTPEYTLRGKTGSRADDSYERAILGWFVGTVETRTNTYVFACNLSAEEHASGSKARELSKTVLRSLGIL